MRNTTAPVLPLLLALAAFCAHASASAAGRPTPTPTPTPQSDPPKPSVSVSFERQAIRENDAVQVHLWIANEWDFALNDVTLRADVPKPLGWRNVPCDEWRKLDFKDGSGDAPLPLDALKAHEVKSYTFCIKSGPEIDVGEFNIPFTFEYGWTRDGAARRSFTTTEKTLKANLFGSDSLAGVPLGLAGLIVPGLFFWVALSLFRVGWTPWPSGDLALGDRLFYSVLASVALLFIINSYSTRSLAFPVFNGGIGLPKLLVYVGVGTAAGVLVGLPIKVKQGLKRMAEARRVRLEEAAERAAEEQERAAEALRQVELELQVQLDDPLDVLIEKLLNKHPNARLPKTSVHLVDGTIYFGTLGEKGESAAALIGSYSVDTDGLDQAVADELGKAQLPLDIFKIVRREKLESRLTPYEVLRVSKGAQSGNDTAGYRAWQADAVLSVEVSQEGGEFEPLRLP